MRANIWIGNLPLDDEAVKKAARILKEKMGYALGERGIVHDSYGGEVLLLPAGVKNSICVQTGLVVEDIRGRFDPAQYSASLARTAAHMDAQAANRVKARAGKKWWQL